jgi:hypothetical protein
MAKSDKKPGPSGRGNGGETPDLSSLGGFFGGLGTLIEKLGELAEKSEEFKAAHEAGEFGDGSKVKGVYGFTIRTGLGDRQGSSVRRSRSSRSATFALIARPAARPCTRSSSR